VSRSVRWSLLALAAAFLVGISYLALRTAIRDIRGPAPVAETTSEAPEIPDAVTGIRLAEQATDSGPALSDTSEPSTAAPPARNASGTAEIALGAISGTLVDARWRPVGNVDITAARGASDEHRTSSEKDGTFVFVDLNPGEYRLSIRRYEFSSIEDEVLRVTLGANEHIAGLRIIVPEVGDHRSISGRVMDKGGGPVLGAQVSLNGGSGSGFTWSSSNDYSTSDTTDDQGRFAFSRLRTGTFEISASHPRFSESPDAPVNAGDSNIVIQLNDLATVEGQVVSEATGRPVTQFEIAIFAGDDPKYIAFFPVTPRSTTVQDADGRFVLTDVQHGATAVSVTAESHAPVKIPIPRITGGETRRGLLVRMSAGATLAGRVVDRGGHPIGEAKIFLAGKQFPFLGSSEADETTGADGTFLLIALPPGNVGFRVEHSDFATKTFRTSVSAQSDNRIDIVMTGGGSIAGSVTLDGKPVTGEDVYADGARDTTDEMGRYEISHVIPGAVTVSVGVNAGRGGRHHQSRQATVIEGAVEYEDFAFFSSNSSIEGTIFESDGDVLREDSTIRLAMYSDSGAREEFTTTPRNGHYSIVGIPGGSGKLTLELESGHYSFPVDLHANQRAIQDFHLSGNATIHLRMSGPPALTSVVVVGLLPGRVETGPFPWDMIDSGTWPAVQYVVAVGGVGDLRRVKPGTYTLFAQYFDQDEGFDDDQLEGAGSVTKVVEIRENEELEVELEL